MSQALKSAEHPEMKRAVPPPNCPFLNSVDDALSVFGDSAKQAIYYYLSKDFDLPREMIPVRAEVFEDVLKVIFLRGAKTILLLVAGYSFNRAGLEPPPETYHMNSLRQIGRKSNTACLFKGKECPLMNCIYFDEEEKTG